MDSKFKLSLPTVSDQGDGADELEAWLLEAQSEGVLLRYHTVDAAGRKLGDQAFSRFVASLLCTSVQLSRSSSSSASLAGGGIQHMDLSGNCLTDTSAVALAECLTWMRENLGGHLLRSLCLASNGIGPAGAEALALSFFPQCDANDKQSEYRLTLSANPLGDEGVRGVVGAIQKRGCNAILELSGVGCGAAGCHAVADGLQWLRGLDLSHNKIPDVELGNLAARLPDSPQFQLPPLPRGAAQSTPCVTAPTNTGLRQSSVKAAAAAQGVRSVDSVPKSQGLSRAEAVLERARKALDQTKSTTAAPVRRPSLVSTGQSGSPALHPTTTGANAAAASAPMAPRALHDSCGIQALQRTGHVPAMKTSSAAQAVLERARSVLQRKPGQGVLAARKQETCQPRAAIAAPVQETMMDSPPTTDTLHSMHASSGQQLIHSSPTVARTTLPSDSSLSLPAGASACSPEISMVDQASSSSAGVAPQHPQIEQPVSRQVLPSDLSLSLPAGASACSPEIAEVGQTYSLQGTSSSVGAAPQHLQSEQLVTRQVLALDLALSLPVGASTVGHAYSLRGPAVLQHLHQPVNRQALTSESALALPAGTLACSPVASLDGQAANSSCSTCSTEEPSKELDGDACNMPSIAALKAEKDARESESLAPAKKGVPPPPKGKGKGKVGKGPPLPAASPKASGSADKGGEGDPPGQPGQPAAPQLPPPPPKGKAGGKGKGPGPKGGKGGPPPPPKGPGPPPKGSGPPKAGGGPLFPKAESKAPFLKKLYWKQVDLQDAEGTIFSDESRNKANATSTAIDFTALTRMLEAENVKGSQLQRRSSGVLSKAQQRNIGTKVLSDHRARNIAIVLKRLPLSTKDLVFVLQRLEWEDNRIGTDDLEQILEAIPTHDEAKKLREHSSDEACQKLRDVEQLVMPLALLSRASARVRVLCVARNARLQFKSTARQLAKIRSACFSIQRSGMLRSVMQLALKLGNYINHGDSTKGAKAIAVSSLMALRDFKAGDISSLHFLCVSLLRANPKLDAAQTLLKELQPAEKIAKMQVQGLSAALRSFARDLDTIKAECQNHLQEYEGDLSEPDPGDEEDAKELGDALAEVHAVATSAADTIEFSPTSMRRQEEDATRWVEDVMKIRGSAQRRLRCMRKVLEKLHHLMQADMEKTADEVHATLRFCGVLLPKSSKEVPADLEVLLSNLTEFTKVFKQHWDEVKKHSQKYECIFSGGEP